MKQSCQKPKRRRECLCHFGDDDIVINNIRLNPVNIFPSCWHEHTEMTFYMDDGDDIYLLTIRNSQKRILTVLYARKEIRDIGMCVERKVFKMKNRKNYLKARKKQLKWKQFGYISTNAVCPLCGAKSLIQFDRYDSWACMSCLKWLDAACGDPDCPYCSIRPSTPYEAYILNDIEADNAGIKKRWRCDNYQHKTNGMAKHETQRRQHLIRKESQEAHYDS